MAQPSIDLSDIIDRARSRADMVGSTFWTDAELTKLAESEFRQFYLDLTSKSDVGFIITRAYNTSVQGSTVQITDPSFMKLHGVRIRNSANFADKYLRRIDLREEPIVSGASQYAKPRFYWLQADPTLEQPFIHLRPIPDAVYTLDVYFLPLYSLKDILVAIGSMNKALHRFAGWDEYLVVKMAISMKDREESDVSVLMMQAQQLYAAIEKNIQPIDQGEPMSVLSYGDKNQWDQTNDPYEDTVMW